MMLPTRTLPGYAWAAILACVALGAFAVLSFALGGSSEPPADNVAAAPASATPSPARSAVASATAMPTRSATPTATATPEPTATPTPEATETAEAVATPTLTPTEAAVSAETPIPPTPEPAAPPPPPPPPAPPAPAQSTATGAPVALRIPRFGVNAGVEWLDILPTGYLDSPHDPYNVGWYSRYDPAGAPGNVLMSGHVDYYPNILGPFYNLSSLAVGDAIELVMPDGSVITYAVITNTRYAVEDVPMEEVIWPSNRPADEEWLTLITCGGDFQPYNGYSGPGYYLHRDVVQARRVE